MNKDVIYIDVEDDITAILSKVKASNEKIVALVPPKRIGVLQSAVNLRLLHRAGEHAKKRIVIITNNHALMSLAASAQLPVAKNLQSKPELAPIAALDIDDGDDVIDGGELPVGEHAKQSKALAVDEIAKSSAVTSTLLAEPPKPGETKRSPKAKKGVPNFNTFRKKLVIGVIAGVLLIAFLVWALVFAPRATVVVAAKTNDSSVNAEVTIGDTLTTNPESNLVKAVKQQKSEKRTIDFAASGSKNVGEKATGSIQFSTNNISDLGTTIPAGTSLLTSNGLSFVTDSAVTITISNYRGAPTTVTASEQGAKYNAANGRLTGAPNNISAQFVDATSGGTDRVVKVVTEEDIQKAKQLMVDGENKEAKSQLKDKFKSAIVIEESYKVDYNDLVSTPSVGTESESGNAVLSATVVYSMLGVTEAELKKYLDAVLKKQVAALNNQRLYENGVKSAKFQDVTNTKDGARATIIATAKVGPKLEESDIIKQSAGRKAGEIQESLQSVQGIENIEVKYFPFWVSSVPNDESKITVQFQVDE